MGKAKSRHVISFGPPIPLVPIRDFSRQRLTREQWEDLWSICGPSVERNMAGRAGRRLELWQIIAAAYLEGLHHGSALDRTGEGEEG